MALFEKWDENFLRPIFVNVATAAILFGLALVFKPYVYRLFSPPDIGYPLLCLLEVHKGKSDKQLTADFYLVNRTESKHTREALFEKLVVRNPNPEKPLAPDVRLRLKDRARGYQIAKAFGDEDFNQDKGVVEVDADSGTINVKLQSIDGWAILRVRIILDNLPPGLLEVPITKANKSQIPFDFDGRCYG